MPTSCAARSCGGASRDAIDSRMADGYFIAICGLA
jgi:hypothetical protein